MEEKKLNKKAVAVLIVVVIIAIVFITGGSSGDKTVIKSENTISPTQQAQEEEYQEVMNSARNQIEEAKKSLEEARVMREGSTTPTNGQNQQAQTSTNVSIIDDKSELIILKEQKVKAESLTKMAVSLIAADKITEAIDLYNARWQELAKLRVEIIYNNVLTDVEKKNIDGALKTEQESITIILSKYDQLYR